VCYVSGDTCFRHQRMIVILPWSCRPHVNTKWKCVCTFVSSE
jgi:hypothetical protein